MSASEHMWHSVHSKTLIDGKKDGYTVDKRERIILAYESSCYIYWCAAVIV